MTRILSSVKEDGAEAVITQQGKPVALIINIEKYLEVQQALKEFPDPEYLADLLEARKEIREGKGFLPKRSLPNIRIYYKVCIMYI